MPQQPPCMTDPLSSFYIFMKRGNKIDNGAGVNNKEEAWS